MILDQNKLFKMNKSILIKTSNTLWKFMLFSIALSGITFMVRSFVPGLKVDMDHVYYVSGLVKNAVSKLSPEINNFYDVDDIVFTFKNSSSKKHLSGASEGKEEGIYRYKIKDTEVILSVYWERNDSEVIDIIKILQKKDKEWISIYMRDKA